jgi:hypothetical protein
MEWDTGTGTDISPQALAISKEGREVEIEMREIARRILRMFRQRRRR